MSGDRFRHDYVERALRQVGGRGPFDGATAVRWASEPGEGRVLAGWWGSIAGEGTVTLPNPWDAREAIALHEREARALAQRAFVPLAQALDTLQGTPRGVPWWELVLSPWLTAVATAVLDRGLFVDAVAALAPGTTLAVAARVATPASVAASATLQGEDGWNGTVIAALAGSAGLAVRELAPAVPVAAVPSPGRPAAHDRLALLADALVRRAVSARRGQDVVLLGQHFLRPSQLLAVGRRVGGVRSAPLAGARPAPPPPPVDASLRAQLAGHLETSAEDGRLAALLGLLPALLPRTMLEGLDALQAAVRRRYGGAADVVDASYAWDDEDGLYLAGCRAAGHRVGFTQHGGCVHQLAVSPVDRLEEQLGDLRLSWGAQGPGVHAVSPPHLPSLRDSHRGGDEVVVFEGPAPPNSWFARFDSLPLGDQLEVDARLLSDTVGLLGGGAAAALRLKRFPGAPPDAGRPAGLSALPPPAAVAEGASGREVLQTARLALLAYPDTPFVEALVIGVPTIGLWSARFWEMADDVAPLFAQLRRCGVIQHDPAVAARHVDAVLADAGSWWESGPVQAARRALVERLARPGDPVASWAAALRALRA